MTKSEAAKPHSLAVSPWVKSATATLHAAGGHPRPPHHRGGLRVDLGFTISVVVLSFLVSQPDQLRSSLGRRDGGLLYERSIRSASRLNWQQYGLPVSPYKAAIPETLETVTNGSSAADAEWQDFVLKLSVQLRRHRLAVGLSQEEVAHRAGLSRFIYRQYESGESRRGTAANPALRSILAIAQVLQVPIGELLPEPVPDLRSR